MQTLISSYVATDVQASHTFLHGCDSQSVHKKQQLPNITVVSCIACVMYIGKCDTSYPLAI